MTRPHPATQASTGLHLCWAGKVVRQLPCTFWAAWGGCLSAAQDVVSWGGY